MAQAINDTWAYILFLVVVLSLVGMTLLLVMFALLALRAVLRFLVHGSVNGVVRSLEQRALRSAKR